ncbi:MAG: hypothetical protein ACPL1B_09610 [Thermoprotei archaeon]
MSYVRSPNNYYGKERKQYRLDIDKMNNNFTILANAFKDNNPDTGIVKEALMLDGFSPSQIPQPSAIPVADINGKIRSDWLYASQQAMPNVIPIADSNGKLSADWFSLNQNNFFNQIPTFDLIGNSSYVSVVHTSLDVGNIIAVNFNKTQSLILDIPLPDNVLLNIKFKSQPTIGEVGYNGSIDFLPNHSTYSRQIIYSRSYHYPERYITNRFSISHFFSSSLYFVFYDIFVVKKGDLRSFLVNIFEYYPFYTDDHNRIYSIPLTQYSTPPRVYETSPYYMPQFWYPYTESGGYIPWSVLGTILSSAPLDGRMIIKRLV